MSPCYVTGSAEGDARLWAREAGEERDRLKAYLCALSGALEESGSLESILDEADWEEVGVPRDWFDAWWEGHKKEDARRRERERRERERQRTAQEAMEKLTSEERRALGIREEP